MRTTLFAVIALLGAGFALTSLRAGAAPRVTPQQVAESAGRGLVGSPAPKLVLRTIEGKTLDLGALYGKQAVYLKFWATWCVPCRQQMPHFQRTFETAGPDLAVIAIDSGFNDSVDDVRKARQELGITMPLVLDDGQAGAAFNLRVTPQHIVIGRDGRIQYVGHLADARLDAALVAARTGGSDKSQPLGTSAPVSTARHGVGDPLPDISATTLDGRTFRARDPGAKRPTVLVFMSPWCEDYLATSRPAMSKSCREVREQVEALARGDTQLRWLAIASGLWAIKDDLVDYEAKYKTTVPLALDESGVWFRSFRVMNVPTILIADARGQIIRRIDGFDTSLPGEIQKLSTK
jgi:peroxiredoxin